MPCFEGKQQESTSTDTKGCSHISNKTTDKPLDTAAKRYLKGCKTKEKDDGIVQNTSHTISFLHILLETHRYHIKKKSLLSYHHIYFSHLCMDCTDLSLSLVLQEEKFHMANFKTKKNCRILKYLLPFLIIYSARRDIHTSLKSSSKAGVSNTDS